MTEVDRRKEGKGRWGVVRRKKRGRGERDQEKTGEKEGRVLEGEREEEEKGR